MDQSRKDWNDIKSNDSWSIFKIMSEFVEAYGLGRWTVPVLTELFTKFDLGIRNEIFIPNIGMACSTCGVKDNCYAVGGQMAEIFDPLAQIK